MKFSFLSLHLFDISSLILLFLIKYSAQNDVMDWAKVNDVIYKGPKFVNEGQTFKIICRMSGFNAPKWTKNDFPIVESNRISFENSLGIELSRVESMTVTNANANDSGFYRCNSFSRAFHRIEVITTQPITSIHESSTLSDIVYEEIKEELSTVVLNCNDLTNPDDNEVLWFKNGVKINSDERRDIQKSKLTIREATSDEDAGPYLCQIDAISARGGSQFGQLIHLRAPIRVKPFKSPQNIVIGRKHRLECHYSGYPVGKITWIVGNNELNEKRNKELNIEIKANNDSHPNSVLIITNVSQNHTNSYTCVVNNGYSEGEASVLIKVGESTITRNSPILLLENKALNIVCNYTADDNTQRIVNWIWKKDGVSYSDFPEESKQRINISPKDYSIEISKAIKGDIGDWECWHNNERETIKVLARPYLIPYEEYQKTNYKSANIVEGQGFHLKCQIIPGYEREATLKWFTFNESEFENEDKVLKPITSSSDSRIRINDENTTIQTLTIDKVVPSDRMYYVCVASNGFSSVNNTILLRVKDKLGALWPFLGIVAEVIILCTIIFIYEKRRIKPDFDESDNDNNTEPKSTQDRSSKPQDVRQRK